MKNIKKIADEITSSSSDMTKLEEEYELLKNANINTLDTDQLQTILAYEMWKDGMEWIDVKELWDGKNSLYTDKLEIIQELKHKFNY